MKIVTEPEEFLSEGNLIAHPISYKEMIDKGNFYIYLWDDYNIFDFYYKYLQFKNKKVYIYTLISEDDKLYISKGIHLIDRLGYFISENEVDFKDGIDLIIR